MREKFATERRKLPDATTDTAIIGGICTGVVLLLVLVLRYKHRLSQRDELTAKYLVQKFNDVMNLAGILVLDKKSGINLYSEAFRDVEFGLEDQAEIVSGIIQAVSILGDQFGKKGLSRLEYGEFKLLVTAGDLVRVVLLTTHEPSSLVEDHLLMFLKKFEKKFHGALDDWKGNVQVFSTCREIVDQEFEVFPFVEAFRVNYDPDSPASFLSHHHEYILEQARELEEEKGFVTFPNLIRRLQAPEHIVLGKRRGSKELLPLLYQLYESRFFEKLASE
ncbi:MAG: hypothetical protein ACTSU5_14725 [Promethearchaeota archaeon]